MRSRKLAPLSESCEKKCLLDIADECPRAAAASFLLRRRGRSLWRFRSTLSVHRVARTSARLLAVLTEALAEAHAPAAEAAGPATRHRTSARTSACAGQKERIH